MLLISCWTIRSIPGREFLEEKFANVALIRHLYFWTVSINTNVFYLLTWSPIVNWCLLTISLRIKYPRTKKSKWSHHLLKVISVFHLTVRSPILCQLATNNDKLQSIVEFCPKFQKRISENFQKYSFKNILIILKKKTKWEKNYIIQVSMSIFYNLEDLINVDCCIPSVLFFFFFFSSKYTRVSSSVKWNKQKECLAMNNSC